MKIVLLNINKSNNNSWLYDIKEQQFLSDISIDIIHTFNNASVLSYPFCCTENNTYFNI